MYTKYAYKYVITRISVYVSIITAIIGIIHIVYYFYYFYYNYNPRPVLGHTLITKSRPWAYLYTCPTRIWPRAASVQVC